MAGADVPRVCWQYWKGVCVCVCVDVSVSGRLSFVRNIVVGLDMDIDDHHRLNHDMICVFRYFFTVLFHPHVISDVTTTTNNNNNNTGSGNSTAQLGILLLLRHRLRYGLAEVRCGAQSHVGRRTWALRRAAGR